MTTIKTYDSALINCPVETTLANWEVVETPLYTVYQKEGDFLPQRREIKDMKAIIRSDNAAVLNVCSPSYHAMSNRQFIETAMQFADVTGFPIENIFEIEEGAKQLAYLKCTEPFEVGGFEFKDHLMLGNSHDGSSGFFVGNSNIMVRCQNRFVQQYKSMKVRHTKSLQYGVDEIVRAFADYRKKLSAYYESLNQMSKIRVSKKLVDLCIQTVSNQTKEERLGIEELSTRKKNMIIDLQESLETEMAEVGTTMLGLFEGVTHYTTHKAYNKAGDPNAPAVFDRIFKVNDAAYKFFLNELHHPSYN